MPTISTLTVDVESKTSGFSKGLKIATLGLGALAAGAAAAFGQFEESQKVMNQTTAVLKSTSGAAGVTAGQVTDLASALSKKAGIDDEAIQTGENMILTFKNISNEAGKGNDIFNQTTKAVLDMSVAMGQDMKSSAIQVGKALNDPIAGISALSRVGVTFSDQQKKQIEGMVKHNDLLGAQKIILKELGSEFGGSAVAQATASGKMGVALGNLAEKIGGLLAPAITAILAKVTEWAQVLTDSLGPALKAVGNWVKDHEGLVKTLAIAIGAVAAAMLVWTVASKIAAAAQLILNLVMAANPFALIALAVIAAAAVIIANWGKVKEFLLSAWNTIKDAAQFIWDHVAIFVLGPMKLLIDWLIDHWRGFKDVFLGIWHFISDHVGAIVQGIVDTVMAIVDAVMTAIEWLGKLNPFAGGGTQAGDIGPKGFVGKSGLQHGGIVTGPMRPLIGEAGPEAVIPLDKLGGFGTVINLTINGDVTGEEIVKKVRDGLLRLQARNATTGL